MAGVYAADDALRDGHGITRLHRRFEYTVTADPDPDVLSRVANQFNFSNTPPWRVQLARDEAGLVVLQIEMCDIAASVADSIRRKLLQLTCVVEVTLRPLDASPSSADAVCVAQAEQAK